MVGLNMETSGFASFHGLKKLVGILFVLTTVHFGYKGTPWGKDSCPLYPTVLYIRSFI